VNTWKVIFATLVIFITGVVTGGLLVSYADRASLKKRPVRPHEAVRPLANNSNQPMATNSRDPQSPRLPGLIQNRMPRAVGLEFLQKLDAEVHLTTGQHERIEQIIKDGQLRNKEILERITPELRREMAETQKSIREILTPEQHKRFEELMKQPRPSGRRNSESMSPDRRPSEARDPRRPLPPKGDSQSEGVPAPPSNNP
jgi:hypothetical protein